MSSCPRHHSLAPQVILQLLLSKANTVLTGNVFGWMQQFSATGSGLMGPALQLCKSHKEPSKAWMQYRELDSHLHYRDLFAIPSAAFDLAVKGHSKAVSKTVRTGVFVASFRASRENGIIFLRNGLKLPPDLISGSMVPRGAASPPTQTQMKIPDSRSHMCSSTATRGQSGCKRTHLVSDD